MNVSLGENIILCSDGFLDQMSGVSGAELLRNFDLETLNDELQRSENRDDCSYIAYYTGTKIKRRQTIMDGEGRNYLTGSIMLSRNEDGSSPEEYCVKSVIGEGGSTVCYEAARILKDGSEETGKLKEILSGGFSGRGAGVVLFTGASAERAAGSLRGNYSKIQ